MNPTAPLQTPASAAIADIEAILGCAVETFCDQFVAARPKWVIGSLSHSDARFLFRTVLGARTGLVVEIGTASGFSTALTCEALRIAHQAGVIGGEFRVVSYDISPKFYADQTKRCGDAAREQLPAGMLEHIDFRNPAMAAEVPERHGQDSVQLLFIDAAHVHPWPTLDLLACLDALSPGASVLLHDINLPVIHARFPHWGVKHLFDDLDLPKAVPTDCPIPNIGRITIPADKNQLRQRLLEIVAGHEWQTEVPADYLAKLGVRR